MKHVVITGSTKGIGFGYAREFVVRGHSVCITGRSQPDVDAAITKLQTQAVHGGRVIGQVCDVSKVDDVQRLWDAAHTQFGTIDIWINNAGYARSGPPLLVLTPEDMSAMVEANVIGTINGCQVAVRGMQAQGHGHIYNTLGAGADGRVLPGMIGYGTTKRAVRYFTDSLIDELKDAPVRVGTISPGVNISEGMLREIAQLPPAARAKTLWPINVLGDYVETTTPWLVERVLDDVTAGKSGTAIAWMNGRKILGRFIMAMFKKRDLFARPDLSAAVR